MTVIRPSARIIALLRQIPYSLLMKKILTVVMLLVLLTSGCVTTAPQKADAPIQHIVVCWLKDSGNGTDRQKIVDVSRTFEDIPGVIEVKVGEVIESDRKIVDDSFDVALVITFKTRTDMDIYIHHPDHEKAVSEVLKPLVNKIVVYDFDAR